MPVLAAFEVLLAIAKTGSLAAAAREVGMTQQAVSARLASIEALTGPRLAVRSTRGSRLTPAGVVVAEGADKLLDVAELVDAGLGALRTESRERITVVASQTIAEQLMPRWLDSLCCGPSGWAAVNPPPAQSRTCSVTSSADPRGG
jgi:molybdate transport repressor ModE-like protein